MNRATSSSVVSCAFEIEPVRLRFPYFGLWRNHLSGYEQESGSDKPIADKPDASTYQVISPFRNMRVKTSPVSHKVFYALDSLL